MRNIPMDSNGSLPTRVDRRFEIGSGRWFRLTTIGISVPLAFCLAVLAYAGSFTRYIVDDYCTAAAMYRYGFLGAQSWWYFRWSGRFSFTFLVSAIELVGIGIVPYLPALTMVGLAGTLTWMFWELSKLGELPYPRGAAIVLAILILFGTLHGAPDLFESFYWQTGLVTYAVPLILLAAYLGLGIFHVKHGLGRYPALSLGLGSVLACIAGGTSETYVAFQTTLVGILLVLAALQVRTQKGRIAFWFLLSGFLGSLLALVTMMLAPGNAQRLAEEVGKPRELPFIQARILPMARQLVEQSVSRSHAGLVLSFGFPFLSALFGIWTVPGAGSHGRRLGLVKWLVVILVAIPVLIVASLLPAAWVYGSLPPNRTLLAAQFLLTCGEMLVGLVTGALARQWIPGLSTSLAVRVLSAAALCLLVWAMSAKVVLEWNGFIPALTAYASAWQERDQALRLESAKGNNQVVAKPLAYPIPSKGRPVDLVSNPEDWRNSCMAQYYGLERISIR